MSICLSVCLCQVLEMIAFEINNLLLDNLLEIKLKTKKLLNFDSEHTFVVWMKRKFERERTYTHTNKT